jgi:hypothetical protein
MCSKEIKGSEWLNPGPPIRIWNHEEKSLPSPRHRGKLPVISNESRSTYSLIPGKEGPAILIAYSPLSKED